MSQNRKGILLVIGITAIYIAIFSILHLAASVENQSPMATLYSLATRGGTIMRGFTITAYCPGRCCNEIWAGMTASGRSMKYYTDHGINIAAVDPSVIPIGSEFLYSGTVYHAVDVGGKIKGKKIDILLPDHDSTNKFGVKNSQNLILLKLGDGNQR